MSHTGSPQPQEIQMNRFLVTCVLLLTSYPVVRADVVLVKTPERGIQPQAVVDAKGNVHLLYFTGNPKAGNLWYARRDPGKNDFGRAIQVNSQDGSAVAVGTIRGGHLARSEEHT